MGRWTALVAAVLVALTAAGCTGDPPASGQASVQPPARQLDASGTQTRFDEGPSDLLAGGTNKSTRDIRVSRATIAWDALSFPAVRLQGEAIHPGETAAFRIAFGAPRCGHTSGPRRAGPLRGPGRCWWRSSTAGPAACGCAWRIPACWCGSRPRRARASG